MQTAMIMHGRGVISDNILWGNARRSPIEVSIERINEMSIALANGVRHSCLDHPQGTAAHSNHGTGRN